MGAEECPSDVWEIIFSLACRDDGSTGLALSRVSRLISAYSKPYRYQSIALMHPEQIIVFESLITSLPPNLRRIKNLFVHCPDPRAFVYTRDTYANDPEEKIHGSQSSDSACYNEDPTWEESASEDVIDDDESDPASGECDSTPTESDDDSLYEPTTEEEAELANEVEKLEAELEESMRMPNPSIQVRGLANLDWLKDSLSTLDRRQYTILTAFRRLLEAVAPSLENLTVHWTMFEYCLLKLMLPELPVLQDLSIYRAHAYPPACYHTPELVWSGPPTIFPSLKRIQIEGYLEAPANFLKTMAPSLICLHTNDSIFKKVKLFLPKTLRKIMLHTSWEISARSIKQELFGENYVGEYVELEVEAYSSDCEVWKEDWVARINGEGDAFSIKEESDTLPSK